MMKLLVLFLLVTCSLAIPIDFVSCATPDAISVVHAVEMEPFPPVTGVDIVIDVISDILAPIFGGDYEILGTVAIIPILPPVTVIEEIGNICDIFPCPVEPGPNQNLTMILPGEGVDIPDLGFTALVTVGAITNTLQEIFCIQTQIPVKRGMMKN